MNELRQRISALLGGKLNLRLVAFTLVLCVGIVAILSALNAPKAYKLTAPSASNSAGASNSLVSATIYVHVVGLVVHPGIYQLPSGSRLFDAIFAAGGFAKGADQSSVNLARELGDGEQVVVTNMGAVGNSVAGASTSGSTGSSSLVSLNRGSETDLESLPRVGPALASRMIDWRTANGGFKSKRDLLKVAGIGPKLYASLENLVTL